MADRQNEQRNCLIPHERASRPLSSKVLLGVSRLCVFEKWASFAASNYKQISSFI